MKPKPSRNACSGFLIRRAKIAAQDWILGHGWNQNNWATGFGHAADLDGITTSNPIYLTAKSLHAAWANSTALHLAGITSTTADPPGGQIQRDDKGEPTGILFESAMQMVSQLIPQPSLDQVANAIEAGIPHLSKMGLTGLHDFDGVTCFQALQKMHLEGKLPIRILKSIPVEKLSAAIQMGLRSGFGDDYLRLGHVKVFADGALGPHTAAMLQPYQGNSTNLGLLFVDGEGLFEIAFEAARNGLALAVHAIGDRANHEVLNGFERLQEQLAPSQNAFNPPSLPQRIEHVQLLHPDDLQRLSNLNILASMQPIHATSDMLMADRYWGERAKLSYAWNSLSAAGTTLLFGSDAPVESPNPFWGIHAAVTRRRQDGTPGPLGWYPEQKLSRMVAISGYTQTPAIASHQQAQLGCLSEGYLADLVILDQDPLHCPEENLPLVKPLATMVGGHWIFFDL